jgi:hypothetical protein
MRLFNFKKHTQEDDILYVTLHYLIKIIVLRLILILLHLIIDTERYVTRKKDMDWIELTHCWKR